VWYFYKNVCLFDVFQMILNAVPHNGLELWVMGINFTFNIISVILFFACFFLDGGNQTITV
jgi:hypothetical protein